MTYANGVGRRGATAAILVVGGGALAAATWIGGDHVLAMILVAFYALAAGVAFLWAGRDRNRCHPETMAGDNVDRR